MLIRKGHIDLIRKISWSFMITTCIDWDELFAEASLAYCEALLKYNHEHKTKITTWAWIYMRNKLSDFVRKELFYKKVLNIDKIECCVEYEFLKDKLENIPISKNEKELIKLTFQIEEQLENLPPKLARGRLIKTLREYNWSWSKIWNSIRELKKHINENRLESIIIT